MTDKIDVWVTLELSRLGEKERPEALTELLYAECSSRDVEIFIPAVSFFRRDNAVTVCVLEGYAFVKAGHPAGFYFEFENSPYINRVLSRDDKGGRYLLYVPDSEILQLKHKLSLQSAREIEVGDRVLISEGAYQNLEGVVSGLDPSQEKAYIRVEGLVSLKTYVELPLQFLKKIDKTS